MRIFQYKILNNFLYLNKKLCKIGLVETSLCCFCEENDETLIHLFVWCPVTKNLWNRFKVWLSTAINLPELSLQNALLGVIETGNDSNMSNTLINHLMLIFKKTLYDMRTSTFSPSIYVLKKRAAKTMKLEYAVVQESNKLNYHWKKWELVKKLLDLVIFQIEGLFKLYNSKRNYLITYKEHDLFKTVTAMLLCLWYVCLCCGIVLSCLAL